LLQEPRRLWRRYVVDMAAFSTFFVRQWLIMRRGFKPETLLPIEDAVVVDDTAILSIKGRMTIENYQPFYETGQKALAAAPNLVINLAETDFLDSSAIGLLIELSRKTREKGGEMWLASVHPDIERTLSILRLNKFFLISPTVEDVFEQKGIILGAKNSGGLKAGVVESEAGAITNWGVVTLPRRMDALTAPEVVENCIETLEQNPYLILDLGETDFLASAGLAALSKLNRSAKELTGELRVANCNDDVLKVIEMVRFDKILAIYPDISSASV